MEKKLKAMGHGQTLPSRGEPRPSTSTSAREEGQGRENANIFDPLNSPPTESAPPPLQKGQEYVEFLRLAYTRIRDLEGKVETLEKQGSESQDELRRNQCFNTQLYLNEQLQKHTLNQSNREQTNELKTILNLEVFERFATVVEQLLKTDQSLVTANNRLLELKNMAEDGVVQKQQMDDRLNKIIESVEKLVAEQTNMTGHFHEISRKLNMIDNKTGVLNEIKQNSERLLQIVGPNAEKLQGAIDHFEDVVQNMNQLKEVVESHVDMVKQVGDEVEKSNQVLAQDVAKEVTEQNSKQDKILEEIASLKEIVQNRLVPTDNSTNAEALEAAESVSSSSSENDDQTKFPRPIVPRSRTKRKSTLPGSKGYQTLGSESSSPLTPPSLSLYMPGSPRPQRRRRLDVNNSDEVPSTHQPAPRQRNGDNRARRYPKRKTRERVDYKAFF